MVVKIKNPKGTNKCVVKIELKFEEDYKRCLEETKV